MPSVRMMAIAVAVPFALHAQQPNDSVNVLSFRFFASHYGNMLAAAFDAIPENKYGFKPSPAQQSVGYIAQHLEAANYGLCSRLGTAQYRATIYDALPDSARSAWPKDSLVARLRASLSFCDTALARLHDVDLAKRVQFAPNASVLVSRTLLAFVTDLAEHYAQLASYMRVMGMVPPSSTNAAARASIDVPASVLTPYAGTYDLPPSAWQDAPGFVIDVSMRDGALYIEPRGRPAVRLWPSSETNFFVKEVDAEVTFTRDAGGAVTGLVLRQNGENRAARKLK